MPCEARTFCLDASVIITFSKNGQFPLLEETLRGRCAITDEVYGECISPRIWLDAAIAAGSVRHVSITSPEDLAFYTRARRQMDKGEASALTIARSLGATLLCDDLEAISVGSSLPGPFPPCEGCAEILCYAVAHSLLSPTQAQVHLETFIAGGAYIPDAQKDYFETCVGR